MSRFRYDLVAEAGMTRLRACLTEMTHAEVTTLSMTHADTMHDGVMDSDCQVCVTLGVALGVDLARRVK